MSTRITSNTLVNDRRHEMPCACAGNAPPAEAEERPQREFSFFARFAVSRRYHQRILPEGSGDWATLVLEGRTFHFPFSQKYRWF
jgi:hypothetical protein